MMRKRLTFGLVTLGSTLVAIPVHAADIHVDASAPPGGDGSAASPVNEIQDGLELAQAGDVVRVAPGTYAPIQTVRDGTAAARIRVVAERRRSAIVQAGGTPALRNSHAYHTYEGLVFDGAYGQSDLVNGGGGDGAEFIDIEARRSGQDCFDLRTVTGVLIQGSYIHHCIGRDAMTGELADGHGVTGDSVFDLTIADTEIAMASGDSLQLSPPREPWGNVRVEGCLLWTAPLDDADAGFAVGTPIGENAIDTKVGAGLDGAGNNPRLEIHDTIAHGFVGFIGNQAAFLLKENVDVLVDGVTVSDSEIGFRLRFPAVVRVQNAVVHSVDNVMRYEDGLTGAIFVSSTIGGGITAEMFEDGGGGGGSGFVLQNVLVLSDALPDFLPAQSNLAVGPEAFVDAPSHDYRLVEGAAPIDAGDALAEVTTDRIGTTRPYGRAHDIGAYEWDPNAGAGDTGGGDDDPDSTDGVDESAGDDAGPGGSPDAGDDRNDAGTDAATSGSAGTSESDRNGCSCDATSRRRWAGWWCLPLLVFPARRRHVRRFQRLNRFARRVRWP